MFIKIKVKGYTPLICNRFTDEAAIAATSGTRTSSAAASRGTPLEICKKKLYYGADGKTLVIPQPNLMRSFVDGGQFHKVGRKQVTTKTSSLLYAFTEMIETEIPIEHIQPWKVDTRPVRIPTTGGRILNHRPMFDDWALTCTIKLEHEEFSSVLYRDIIDDAGSKVGLGDFRPSTKGPYGRYKVVSWEESETPFV